jgi:uncharacterized protein RhaS with RHS repeats
MTVNEESRQLEVAAEVEAAATTLAHSTRTVPSPSDSYRLVGELAATLDSLEQVCRQLSQWHNDAEDGQEYDGQDTDEFGKAAAFVGTKLTTAAEALGEAGRAVQSAHSANGAIRWQSHSAVKGG